EVVLINIDDKDNINFPYFRAFSELEGQLNDGSARILQYDPDLRLLAPDEIYLQKHAASRDTKWQIIKDIVINEPEIYQAEHRGPLVRDACEQSGKALKLVFQ